VPSLPVADLPVAVRALVGTRLGDTARVSVWAGEPGGAAWFTREPDAQHYAASTMKLPLLVAAYRRAERGELDLARSVPVHNEHRSAYDGSVFSLEQDDDQDDETWDRLGSEVDLRTLARHAVVRSGNLATDLLLEHVGTPEVATVLRDAGCSAATVLPRGIGDAVAREHRLDNLVTAADLARVIGGVAARTLARADTCEAVEAVLARQEHREQVPAGLPEGTYVANKTGWVDGVAHDVALVRPDHGAPYVLAVCTTAEADEQTLYAVNAAVSRAVWEARPA
jgi:beta-lactamase class A